MSFALIGTEYNRGGVSGGTTTAMNTTGANLIVLYVSYYHDYVGSLTISDSKGNTWTALTGSGTTTSVGCKFYYCLNPTVGSGHTFTSGGTAYSSIHASAWSGAHASATLDQQNGATGTSVTSLSTGSVTPTEDNELIIYGCSGGTSTSADITAVNVGTLEDHWPGNVAADSYAGGVGYEIQTTATARNPSFTNAITTTLAARIVTFKAAAGGGGGSVPNFYHHRQSQGMAA